MTWLAVLAVWRLTYMLQNDSLPFGVLDKFRRLLFEGSGAVWEKPKYELAKGYACFNCLSIWVAIPFALLFAWYHWGYVILLIAAFSGGAMLVNKVYERLG